MKRRGWISSCVRLRRVADCWTGRVGGKSLPLKKQNTNSTKTKKLAGWSTTAPSIVSKEGVYDAKDLVLLVVYKNFNTKQFRINTSLCQSYARGHITRLGVSRSRIMSRAFLPFSARHDEPEHGDDFCPTMTRGVTHDTSSPRSSARRGSLCASTQRQRRWLERQRPARSSSPSLRCRRRERSSYRLLSPPRRLSPASADALLHPSSPLTALASAGRSPSPSPSPSPASLSPFSATHSPSRTYSAS